MPGDKCVCERDPWYKENGLLDPHHGHVVNCSPKVLKGAPEDLKYLFECGAKHRPEMFHVVMTPEIRAQVVEELDEALSVFVESNGQEWEGWSEIVGAHLHEQLYTLPAFADGVVFENKDKPHKPGTRFVPYLDAYDRYIKDVHRDFVVTGADKVSNNLVVTCKKWYIQQNWADLQPRSDGQSYYSIINPGPNGDPHTTVTDMLLAKLTGPYRDVCDNMYPECCNDLPVLRERLTATPYQAALVKLHKNPIAMRFLACSGQNALKPPAQWLTCLLRAIQPDLESVWGKLFSGPLELRTVRCKPWYATRSAQVVDTVRRFNYAHMSVADFVAGGGWQGYDVVRLYTNINTSDLKAKLWEVLDWAWAEHDTARHSCVQVFLGQRIRTKMVGRRGDSYGQLW